MEAILPEIVKNSPFLAGYVVALLIIFKLAEQKVGMAQAQAARERQMGEECKAMSDERMQGKEILIAALNKNTESQMALANSIRESNMMLAERLVDLQEIIKKTGAAESKRAAKAAKPAQ